MILTPQDHAQAMCIRKLVMVRDSFGTQEHGFREPPYPENEYTQALRSDVPNRHIALDYGIDETSVRGHRVKLRKADKRKTREVAV